MATFLNIVHNACICTAHHRIQPPFAINSIYLMPNPRVMPNPCRRRGERPSRRARYRRSPLLMEHPMVLTNTPGLQPPPTLAWIGCNIPASSVGVVIRLLQFRLANKRKCRGQAFHRRRVFLGVLMKCLALRRMGLQLVFWNSTRR